MSAYRTPAPAPKEPASAPGCSHLWEVQIIWAFDEWRIVGWRRRCARCHAPQPFPRRVRNFFLDTLRLLGLYDRNHEKLDADRHGDSLHLSP